MLINLFHRYGLVANVAKSNAVTCQMGTLRSRMSEEVVRRWCTGRGMMYHVRPRRWITCPDCGLELTTGFIMAHRWRMYGTEPEIDWNGLPVSQKEQIPKVFEVNYLKGMSHCQNSFTGCLGSSRIWSGLRNHFNHHHWGHRRALPILN